MNDDRQLLYQDYARYYDLEYSFHDYQREVQEIIDLVGRYGRSDGAALLDVACGTGKHLALLGEHFRCTGVDANDGMLTIARERLPDLPLYHQDMTHLDLGRRFDVITCLGSAIGYLISPDDLHTALAAFARHLQPGGVALIVPWVTRFAFDAGRPGLLTYDTTDLKIARASTSRVEGSLSILDWHTVVAERDRAVVDFRERHTLRLFDRTESFAMLRAAGLEPYFEQTSDPVGRGILVGCAPPGG